MRTSIHIGALHFYAHHGVLPQEQKVGNYFKVETRSHYPQITGGRLIVTKEKPPIPGDIRDVSVIVEW